MIVDRTFVHWAVERENVRVRREDQGLPPPWTEDSIIASHRFCNVSREDDRVTRWIKENIRDPWGDSPFIVPILALARHINYEESLDELMCAGAIGPAGISYQLVCDMINERTKHGERSFNSAYMIRSEVFPDCPFKASPEFVNAKIMYVATITWRMELALRDAEVDATRAAWSEWLMTNYGFADFMAGQVVADLAYTPLLRDAPDHLTWAPFGPGAVRGMNRALGRKLNATITHPMYLAVAQLQMDLLPPDLVEGRQLTLHDVASNINCETDKYLRIKNGEGKGRKYVHD